MKMDRYLEYIGLFSVMLLSTTLAGCPSKCVCSKNAVRCTEKSLLDVPNFENLNNDPIVVDVSSNEIDYLTRYSLSFEKASVVQILILNNSKIIDVEETAFKELINVKEIYLSRNLLSDLPPNAFRYNDALTYLDLSYNLFGTLPEIRSKSLRVLNLRNSGVEQVLTERFNWIPNLEYLYMERNNLRQLDLGFTNYLPKLSHIALELNAWQCTCESVKMFEILRNRNLVTITEPIQCRNQNDLFINIFNETGVPETVKQLCAPEEHMSYNFGGELNEVTTERKKRKYMKKKQVYKLIERKNSTCRVVENVSTHYTYLVFAISVFFSFVVGSIVGALFFSQKPLKDDSSSCNSLLKTESVV